MDRRQFLKSAAAASATLALPRVGRAFGQATPDSGWRTFEVTTRVEVLNPSGPTLVWLPAAQLEQTPYQKTLANTFQAESGTAELVPYDGFGIVTAKYPAGARPVLTLVSKVSTRNYTVDVEAPAHAPKPPEPDEMEECLRGSRVLPVDGIVKKTADSITQGLTTDDEKARAIYEWIVTNTFRNPKTRGCGFGDIRYMLEAQDLGGKCADLNALYVGLARAAGLPARDIYGVRIAPSQIGYKSLGLSSDNATKAQHCRAEVYLAKHGWVPVDPADVRKVILEEPPGNHPMDDEVVQKARARLFGSWEMNWMAYNSGHDVALPGSTRHPVNYFMYPQAETAEGRVDPLDPDKFKYEITAKELPAAA
jgi:transglutaminase-like putative cysteine protease